MLNGHIIEAVEALAHPAYQESWDNTGLQVGSRAPNVQAYCFVSM